MYFSQLIGDLTDSDTMRSVPFSISIFLLRAALTIMAAVEIINLRKNTDAPINMMYVRTSVYDILLTKLPFTITAPSSITVSEISLSVSKVRKSGSFTNGSTNDSVTAERIAARLRA